jgi:mono/diheme cytochrome c family protein
MMSNDSHELFNEIVYNGIYSENGMTAFSDVIAKNDVNNIYHYIVNTAKSDRKTQQSIKP